MNKIQKELKNRLTLKSVKTMLGTDGNIITCSVYFDGKRIANYSHDGRGGMGQTFPLPKKVKGKNDYTFNSNKIKELETLISKLPSVKSDFGDHDLKPDIDWVIEDLIGYMELEKNCKKGICFGKNERDNVFGLPFPRSYQIVTFRGVRDLSKINPTQLKNTVAKIKKESLKKGEIILNTNLPK